MQTLGSSPGRVVGAWKGARTGALLWGGARSAAKFQPQAGEPAPDLSQAPACHQRLMTLVNALLSQPQFPHLGAPPGTNTV